MLYYRVINGEVTAVKKALTYFVIGIIALAGALNYQLLVFPNRFAPAGLNGLCTMVQYLSGISVGYMSLLINIPLAAAVFFRVSRPMALRAMVYVAVFSGALVVLDWVDLSAWAYATENSAILGPVVAGVVNGCCYALLSRAGTVTGGLDFVASLIHKKNPEINLFWLIFTLNCFVAAISYFVYGFQVEPVIMCIVYSFITSIVTDQVGKSIRSAVRFEIITQHPEEISQAIVSRLHHSATLLPGKGIYKGIETSVLICIVNRPQAAALSAIIRSYPNTFAVQSGVSEVMGNFKRLDKSGKPEVAILDPGSGEL